MKLVIFEDDSLEGFGSLVALRHLGALRRGTKTMIEAIEEAVGSHGGAELWGREVIKDASRESLEREYNEGANETALFVNARARPGKELRSLASRPSSFVALVQGHLVAARLRGRSLKPGVVSKKDIARVSKDAERLEASSECLFRGYWGLVESNGLAVAEQAGHFADTLSLPDAVEVKGPPSNLRIEGTAEVEKHVTFDVRPGPVVIDRGATVDGFTRIKGPSYIGAETKLTSAQVDGGTSVFEVCNIGGEVESSVIMPHTNKAHDGYVGHSYVGEWVNLGAGSNFSNLKNTYGNVRVELGNRREDSGMIKLGPAIGDMCKVSIGALVYAGKLVGTASHVSGLASHNVPSFTHFDGFSGNMTQLILESVLETQRRMMERRGRTPTRAQEELIRRAYAATSAERRKAGVKRGRIA